MSLIVTTSKKFPDLEIRSFSNLYIYADFWKYKGKQNSAESNLVTDLEVEQWNQSQISLHASFK